MQLDKIEKAVVICGGEGTRLRPMTYETPKPLVKVNGVAVIDNIVSELKANGISNITLAIGYRAEMFMEHFGDGSRFGVKVDYSVEKKLLGTGGAIKKALLEKVDLKLGENVLVANGDNIFGIDLMRMNELHRPHNAMATIAVKSVEDITGYGVISVENDEVKKFVEKPKPEEAESTLINLGIYILNQSAIAELPETEAFSMERDFFEKLADTGKLYAFVSDKIWYPIDTIERYNRACREWKPNK
jgi:NDP-sugar pyrophosphorylase family protein